MESLIHCMHQYTIQLQHTNQYTTIQLQYTMNLHQYIIQLQYTRSQNHQYTRNQSIIHLQLLYTKSQSIIHLQLLYTRSQSIIQLQLQYTRSQSIIQLQYTRSQNQFIIPLLQLQLTRHHQLQFTILLQHLWLQQVSVSTDDIKKLKYNCPFNGIGVTSTVECTHGDRNVCFWATLDGRCLADSKIDIIVCRYNILTIHCCRYNSYDYNGNFSIVHYYPLFQHTTQYYIMHQNHIIISTFLHIIQFQHHQLTKAMHLIIVLSKFGEKLVQFLAQNGEKS